VSNIFLSLLVTYCTFNIKYNNREMKKLFIAIFSIALLGSCGGGSNEEQTPKTVRKAEGFYKEGDKKYKIHYGGIFRMNEVADFKNLHPHAMVDVVSTHIGTQIFQGLFKLNQKTLEPELCLAKSYDVNDDATVWTFELQEGVKFHDDACFEGGKGRTVDANDVKYCFDKLCEAYPDNKLYSMFKDRVEGANEYYESTKNGDPLAGGVSGIRVIDNNKIEIKLVQPFSSFDKVLSYNCGFIFPKEALEKYGSDIRVHPVGTGPFMVDKIKEGVQVRLVRNENYWESDEHGNQLPYLDVVKVTFTKDKKTELSNFKRGNLDMVYQLPVDELSEVMVDLEEAMNGGNQDFQYQQKDGLATQFYSFLTIDPIFKDVNVRKAFNYAIDRETIVKYTLQGEGDAAVHGIVPNFPGYNNETIDGFTFNPSLAKKHISEAGYPGGKGFPELTLYINESGSKNTILAENIQKMLQENIGVKIKIEPLQFPVLIERFTNGQIPFWRMAWVADYPDPENFLKLFYGKSVPAPNQTSYPNVARYQNEEFDVRFEKALASTDKDLKDQLYHECDSILIADAAYMPIYYDEYIRLLQLNVRSFPQNAMEYRDLTRVFFSKDE